MQFMTWWNSEPSASTKHDVGLGLGLARHHCTLCGCTLTTSGSVSCQFEWVLYDAIQHIVYGSDLPFGAACRLKSWFALELALTICGQRLRTPSTGLLLCRVCDGTADGTKIVLHTNTAVMKSVLYCAYLSNHYMHAALEPTMRYTKCEVLELRPKASGEQFVPHCSN